MAHLKIKGKSELIFISNERAKKIKVLLFGDPKNNVSPDPKTNRIDLGEWSGELSMIAYVELDKAAQIDRTKITEDQVKKVKEGISKFKAKTFPHRLQGITLYPEDLYAADLHLIKVDEYGQISVVDPIGYTMIQNVVDVIRERSQKKEFAIKKELEEMDKKMVQ